MHVTVARGEKRRENSQRKRNGIRVEKENIYRVKIGRHKGAIRGSMSHWRPQHHIHQFGS